MQSSLKQALPSTQHKALRLLLLDLFDASELKMFVADHYPEALSSVAWLQAPAKLAFDLVEALSKRGVLDGAFRAALLEARPARQADINGIWGAVAGSASAARATPPTAIATNDGAGAPAGPPVTIDPAAPFDVFLSHNSKDKPLVREVAQQLQARGLRVWLDEWELIPGRPWQVALEAVIETVKTAAVFVGAAGMGPWEEPEMRACLSQFVNRGLLVIPVLLPGAPDNVKLPLFLQAFTWVDLRRGDGNANIDRLQWGITGKKPPTRP